MKVTWEQFYRARGTGDLDTLLDGAPETESEFDALQLMRDQTPEQQQEIVALLKCYMLSPADAALVILVAYDEEWVAEANDQDGLLFGVGHGKSRGGAILALAKELEARDATD